MLTEQDVLTVGASYWLRQRADGSGPVISGLMEDTGLSRDAVKAAVKKLETDHKEWLDDYKAKVEEEARGILVSEEVTRLRRSMANFAGKIVKATKDNFFKLHEQCQNAALDPDIHIATEKQFEQLKVKQYERQASLKVVSTILGVVERLEAATQPKAAPVFNNTNIQVPTEQKVNRFLKIGEFEPEGNGSRP